MLKGDSTLLIPILLPMLAGGFLYLCPWIKGRKRETIYAFMIVFITLVSSFFFAHSGHELILFELMDGVNIYFKIDKLGRMFLLLTEFMWLLSANYSEVYLKHEEHTKRYNMFFLISLGSVLGISCAGNMITMYLFYEWMALSLVALVLHTQTVDAIGAGLKFLFYSIAGALMGFAGIAVLAQFTRNPSMDFQVGGFLDGDLLAGHETFLLIMTFFMILGFGCKAGMFPLHGWLPTAHPVAPAPASAILSGNVTKTGILAVMRVVYYGIGVDFIKNTWVQTTWIILALITIFMGSMLAYKEPDLKKRLAYSTISNLSYIMLGLALCHPIAMMGALMHVVFHSIAKNTLFLTAGSIIYRTGKHRVEELVGIGKRMPVTMWGYVMASLTLIGIPPTSAFLSKWFLAQGAMESQIFGIWWIAPVILLLSALLTAGYLLPIAMKAFFPGNTVDYGTYTKKDVALAMKEPVVLCAVLGVLFGLYPKPFMDLLEAIIWEVF